MMMLLHLVKVKKRSSCLAFNLNTLVRAASGCKGAYAIVLVEGSQMCMQKCGSECQAGGSKVRRSASRVQSRSSAAGRHELELHETITKAGSLTYFQTPSSCVASHILPPNKPQQSRIFNTRSYHITQRHQDLTQAQAAHPIHHVSLP